MKKPFDDILNDPKRLKALMTLSRTKEEAFAKAEAAGLDISNICEPIDQAPFRHLFPNPAPRNWKILDYGQKSGYIYRSMSNMLLITDVGLHHDGKKWLHVSISRPDRIPDYNDLCRVKSLFIGDDKKAIMVFPAQKEHVNIHERCLHLWHCLDEDPLPDFSQGSGSI